MKHLAARYFSREEQPLTGLRRNALSFNGVSAGFGVSRVFWCMLASVFLRCLFLDVDSRCVVLFSVFHSPPSHFPCHEQGYDGRCCRSRPCHLLFHRRCRHWRNKRMVRCWRYPSPCRTFRCPLGHPWTLVATIRWLRWIWRLLRRNRLHRKRKEIIVLPNQWIVSHLRIDLYINPGWDSLGSCFALQKQFDWNRILIFTDDFSCCKYVAKIRVHLLLSRESAP